MPIRKPRKLSGAAKSRPVQEIPDEGLMEPSENLPSTSETTNTNPSINDALNVVKPGVVVVHGKTINKKKKKNRRRKRNLVHIPDFIDGKELDEIDKSLLEVNAILGEPPKPDVAPPPKKRNFIKELLSVNTKHLDCRHEIRKLLKMENVYQNSKLRTYLPYNVVKYRRGIIVMDPEGIHYPRVGLSMSMVERKNNNSHFVIDHNREYQRVHQAYLEASSNGNEDFTPQDTTKQFHIEAQVEYTDYLLRTRAYMEATEKLEQMIGFYQYIFHPTFNLTDQRVRLEYRYLENRPFHVIILKYLHLLSIRVCHRTALELAKLLLNLDPSDPLAVLFIIDTLALRACENKWLVELIDFWKVERKAVYLFNMQYSHGLALFCVTEKMKSNICKRPSLTDQNFDKADELIQSAISHFPIMASWILEDFANEDSIKILKHPLFSLSADPRIPERLKIAFMLHAKLVKWRYSDRKVLSWFNRNIMTVINKYDTDPEFKLHIEKLAEERSRITCCPIEIQRHLHVVRSMSRLIVEWELPGLTRQHAWDPVPSRSFINRYNYNPIEISSNYYSVLFNLYSSVVPSHLPAERRVRTARNLPIDIMSDRERQRVQNQQRNERRQRVRAERAAVVITPVPDSSSDTEAAAGNA